MLLHARRLIFILFLPSVGFCSGIYNPGTGGGSSLGPGSTNYIQNISALQSGATFYVSSGTAITLIDQALAGSGTRCVQTDNTGLFSVAGAACGSGGGGGGTSALGISSGSALVSVVVSSPTSNVVFSSNTFIVNLQGTTTSFVLPNPSSVTLQGPLPTQLGTVSQGVWQGSVIDDTYLPTDVIYFDVPATFISSVTIVAPLGSSTTYGVSAGTFTGNGAGITSLTGANITSNLPTSVLPSTIAYTSISNVFTSSQTVTSSMSITGAAGLSVTYGVSVGSVTGGGLGTCGSATQALGYTSTSTFACQTITGSGGGGGIVSAGTFTWVNNFGIQISTLVVINSTSPVSLSVSTAPLGVTQLAVSSAIAINPIDPILSISSASGTTILWIDNAGNLISSGTTPTVSSCGTSPSVIGNNISGQITVGGGVVTACTLTFANGGFVNAPFCVGFDNSTTVSVSDGGASATQQVFNLSATLGGGLIKYVCFGFQK
jgi:hypothetical protein